MTLLNKTLSSLAGGISQQSPSLRLSAQCEDQINFKSSLVNGLQSRPPLVYKSEGGAAGAAFYAIDRDDDFRYNLFVSPSDLKITDVNGVEQTVAYAAGWQSYLAVTGADPYKTYKVLTLADHTFILNTEKVTALKANAYEAWKNQALVFIKQVNYTTTWTLTINGHTVSVGIGGQESDGGNPKAYINGVEQTDEQGRAELSTTWVASKLSALIQAAVGSFTITQKGAVLWIRHLYGSAFSIGVADSRADSCVNLVTSKVQQFDNLPTVAPDGYIARVVGAVSSNADDYYVKFNCNSDTSFGKGTWEECAEPGSQYALDPALMPWKLIHTSGTAWTFAPAVWTDKQTGDLDSSPIPQFIGKKLHNIFLFGNRLCFLAADLLCMSAASDYTNFWNETAIALSDADPIFISASTETYAELYDFGVLDDDLILFSAHDQFRLSSGDILSPKTAAIRSIANNAYANGTGIVAAGTRLYFGYKSGDWYSACEFGTSAVTGQKEANPITSHVPSLIGFGTKLRITGSENVDTLCVCSDAQPDTLYVYQYYIAGTNKLQASWYKYKFTGSQIKGILFRENILWLHIIKNGVSITAALDMAERTESLSPDLALDLAWTYSGSSASSFTIPAYLDPTKVTAIGYTLAELPTPLKITARTPNIQLDKEATSVLIGEPYERSYIFSAQYPSSKDRSGTEKAVTSGRWQLQQLRLNYGLSGPYDVKIQPVYNNTDAGFLYKFSGRAVGIQNAKTAALPMSEGCFIVPLRGKNTDLRVSLVSSSWLPNTFISAEFQGNYITKVKQI